MCGRSRNGSQPPRSRSVTTSWLPFPAPARWRTPICPQKHLHRRPDRARGAGRATRGPAARGATGTPARGSILSGTPKAATSRRPKADRVLQWPLRLILSRAQIVDGLEVGRVRGAEWLSPSHVAESIPMPPRPSAHFAPPAAARHDSPRAAPLVARRSAGLADQRGRPGRGVVVGDRQAASAQATAARAGGAARPAWQARRRVAADLQGSEGSKSPQKCTQEFVRRETPCGPAGQGGKAAEATVSAVAAAKAMAGRSIGPRSAATDMGASSTPSTSCGGQLARVPASSTERTARHWRPLDPRATSA